MWTYTEHSLEYCSALMNKKQNKGTLFCWNVANSKTPGFEYNRTFFLLPVDCDDKHDDCRKVTWSQGGYSLMWAI